MIFNRPKFFIIVICVIILNIYLYPGNNLDKYYSDQAYEYYLLKKFDQSLDYINKALKYNQNNSQIYFIRALINLEYNYIEKSLIDFIFRRSLGAVGNALAL